MMLNKACLCRQKVLKLQKWIQIAKNYSTQNESIETILRSELKGNTKESTTKLLIKNQFLLEIPPKTLRKSFQALRKLGFLECDIRMHPKLLRQSHYELINNFHRLREIGFLEVTAYRLANTREIMSQSVHHNECFNFLPKNRNILQDIFLIALVPTEPIDQTAYNRDMKLETVHRIALQKYMRDHVGYSVEDIDALWQRYAILKNRSLQSIDKTARLLELIYNEPMKNLPKLSFTMNPEEIEELIHMDTVCGIDVRKIMILAPRCNAERLREVQRVCQSYNVPDYVLAHSPKLFLLNCDTLDRRLNVISKLKRPAEILKHVGIGRVILCMDRLRSYLKSKRLSFNAVFDDNFIDFYLNGFISPNTNPPIFYLCYVFKTTEDEIKRALQQHPHSRRLLFPVVYGNIEYLLMENFTYDDIFEHLEIILYSLDEIKEFFHRIKSPAEMKKLNIDANHLTKSQILRLCTYFIEKKCNFNGDGVFVRSHAAEFDDEYSLRMEEIIKAIKC